MVSMDSGLNCIHPSRKTGFDLYRRPYKLLLDISSQTFSTLLMSTNCEQLVEFGKEDFSTSHALYGSKEFYLVTIFLLEQCQILFVHNISLLTGGRVFNQRCPLHIATKDGNIINQQSNLSAFRASQPFHKKEYLTAAFCCPFIENNTLL